MRLSDLVDIINADILVRGDLNVSYLDLSTICFETDPADYSYDEEIMEDIETKEEFYGERCGC